MVGLTCEWENKKISSVKTSVAKELMLVYFYGSEYKLRKFWQYVVRRANKYAKEKEEEKNSNIS